LFCKKIESAFKSSKSLKIAKCTFGKNLKIKLFFKKKKKKKKKKKPFDLKFYFLNAIIPNMLLVYGAKDWAARVSD
jgi:hypothetical protein